MMTTNKYITDTKEEINPIKVANLKGAVEKETIPSTAYLNSFQNDQVV